MLTLLKGPSREVFSQSRPRADLPWAGPGGRPLGPWTGQRLLGGRSSRKWWHHSLGILLVMLSSSGVQAHQVCGPEALTFPKALRLGPG